MADCIFCKIVAGEIQPAAHIYQDEHVMAFLDIAPSNPGHILVIPKKHYSTLEETPGDILANVIKVVKKMGRAVKDGLGVQGYNVAVNNDPIAGQIIPHLHFHVVPRYRDDGLELWPQGKYKEGEAEEVAEKLKSYL